MSIGRPIITTDAPGCRDSIIDGYNGFLVNARDSLRLLSYFKDYSYTQFAKKMSLNSRQLAEKQFDVRIVNKLMIDKIISF